MYSFDRRFGAVVALAKTYVNSDGFSIGSQIAAAGSVVLTGVKEGLHLRRQSYFVQFELMTKCVLARWADENLQVWEASISKATKRVLDELADEQFYGGELQQLGGGEDEDTAFGFKLEFGGGLVLAQAAKNYANEAAGEVRASTWPHVHGGSQFSSERVKKATVVGRILRELDMTNKGQEFTEANVARTVLEMMRGGYEDRLLRSALERVSRSSWAPCYLAKRALREWSDDEVECWCKSWDVAQKATQVADRVRRCLERRRGE